MRTYERKSEKGENERARREGPVKRRRERHGEAREGPSRAGGKGEGPV